MSTPSKIQDTTFDLLSQPARQRLRARISDAGGTILTVRDEVAAELAELDQQAAAGANASSHQAQRAFHVAQLDYLDYLAQSEQAAEPTRGRSLWSRLTRSSGRT